MVQTKHYVFTLNNYIDDDLNRLRAIAQTAEYLVFGKEVGANGTPHLQGYICFAQVKTFLQARNLIGIRAHIERKRGTVDEAADYCKKDGDFEEFGALPIIAGNGGKFNKFVTWVKQFYDENGRPATEKEIALEYPSLFVMYGHKLHQLAKYATPDPVLQQATEWRRWQLDLKQELLPDCTDDRGVVFYVDEEGGAGKSWFQRVMVSEFPDRVQLLSSGKRDDIAFAVDEHKDIFMFNIARGQMEYLNYSVLEMLKDRMVFSSKYNSKMKILHKVPHVIVFCNEHPNMEKMTDDRYIIRDPHN